MLRTAFLGTPELAIPSLQVLAQHSAVQVVLTQPDRPSGRGNRLAPPPVKTAAEVLGLPVWQPGSLKGVDPAPLRDLDLIVVLAFGEILRQEVLDLPRFGCVNLHASLLPRWRGASPLQAAIRAGDAQTGVSVMRMVRGLDAGPVWSRHEISLASDATLPWLHDRMAELAATALADFLEHRRWQQEPESQDPAAVTVCGKLERRHGQLDPRLDARELERQVRAYTPAPGCWLQGDDGQELKVLAAALVDQAAAEAGALRSVGKRLYLDCACGALELLRVQPPGAKAMEVAAYLNGRTAPVRACPPPG
jgi:methionyl-tRNA formyltransferase